MELLWTQNVYAYALLMQIQDFTRLKIVKKISMVGNVVSLSSIYTQHTYRSCRSIEFTWKPFNCGFEDGEFYKFKWIRIHSEPDRIERMFYFSRIKTEKKITRNNSAMTKKSMSDWHSLLHRWWHEAKPNGMRVVVVAFSSFILLTFRLSFIIM